MKRSNEIKLEKWKSHISAQKDSGQSMVAYCKANGLSPHTFGYWAQKIKLESEAQATPPPFLPVQVVAKQSAPGEEKQLPDPKWVAEVLLHLALGFR